MVKPEDEPDWDKVFGPVNDSGVKPTEYNVLVRPKKTE